MRRLGSCKTLASSPQIQTYDHWHINNAFILPSTLVTFQLSVCCLGKLNILLAHFLWNWNGIGRNKICMRESWWEVRHCMIIGRKMTLTFSVDLEWYISWYLSVFSTFFHNFWYTLFLCISELLSFEGMEGRKDGWMDGWMDGQVNEGRI